MPIAVCVLPLFAFNSKIKLKIFPFLLFLRLLFFFSFVVCIYLISDKLLTTEGRDLRRALFSLKQIFQEDKDLVHGFVALGGLNCLVRVGSGADQNYQNYILRALGQVNIIKPAKKTNLPTTK